MNDELQILRRENERLLSYIRACRVRFGDAAVNSAIMEMCAPMEANPRQPKTDMRAAWARVSALANTADEQRLR